MPKKWTAIWSTFFRFFRFKNVVESFKLWIKNIEEGFIQKRRQRSPQLFGEHNFYLIPCPTSYFAPV